VKLIVEKWDGAIYVYRETEAHFRKAQKDRRTPRIGPEEFAEECNVGFYDDFHAVFDLKPQKAKK
jgi:hypothetical protein